MSQSAVRLKDKLALFSEHWSPKVVAQMNDYHFKIAKIQGEFIWHSHAETDETFFILEGELVIELRDGRVELSAGDLYVVARGVEHRPVAEEECSILLIEPAGTVNTGGAGGGHTVLEDTWI